VELTTPFSCDSNSAVLVFHVNRNQAGTFRRGPESSLLAILVLAAITFNWPHARATASDWPQFLGPARNGTCVDSELALEWPKEGPVTLWQKNVGEGFSGPVVVRGKLILFHQLNDTEIVECLNAESGTSVWSFDYPTTYKDDYGRGDGPRATPAVQGGRVYTFGAEGALHCLDLETGKKIWSLKTKDQFKAGKGFFGMVCSPLVEGNALLINVGGKDGAGIVAFDKSTGQVLWKASDDEASYSSPVVATLHGRRVAIFFTRNFLTALDPASGKVFFEFPWRPQIQTSVSVATPLVIDDLIFISASYGAGAALLRFKESGPEKIWSGDDILSNHYATSVHHNGFLYGFDGRQEQGCRLRCVELNTGKVRWSEDGFGAGTLMLVKNELLILTEKGELIRAAATPSGFKPIARAQILPFSVRAYPALASGLFYARSKNKLVCLDLRNKP
jgi:outer membrane protein assembly factor BamB